VHFELLSCIQEDGQDSREVSQGEARSGAPDNEKTEAFVRELHWPRCRITRYDRARHSLEFEDDAELYFRDLVSFIEEAAE
jgi:hypothetical protein